MKSLNSFIIEKLIVSKNKPIKPVYDLIEIILMSCNDKDVVESLIKKTNGETAKHDKEILLNNFIESLRDNLLNYDTHEDINCDDFCDDLNDYIYEFEFDEYYYSYKDFNDYEEYRITVDNYFTGDADMYTYQNMAEDLYKYLERIFKYNLFYENSEISKMFDNKYEHTMFDFLIKYSELFCAADADGKMNFEDDDAQDYFNN